MEGKIVVFSAPSGSGKSTIINALKERIPNLGFSVSATSRKPRGEEVDGKEYFFLTPEDFKERIKRGEFLEYEEVYKDTFYGTLRSQVEERLRNGENVVLDIDVKGALNVKRIYGYRALLVFIKPPSLDQLRIRLEGRATESKSSIETRLRKADYELGFAEKFDVIITNDVLNTAVNESYEVVTRFLATND